MSYKVKLLKVVDSLLVDAKEAYEDSYTDYKLNDYGYQDPEASGHAEGWYMALKFIKKQLELRSE